MPLRGRSTRACVCAAGPRTWRRRRARAFQRRNILAGARTSLRRSPPGVSGRAPGCHETSPSLITHAPTGAPKRPKPPPPLPSRRRRRRTAVDHSRRHDDDAVLSTGRRDLAPDPTASRAPQESKSRSRNGFSTSLGTRAFASPGNAFKPSCASSTRRRGRAAAARARARAAAGSREARSTASFASRTATGALRRDRARHPLRLIEPRPRATTRATRRERWASSAERKRPVRIMSIASALPTARVSRCVPPAPGMTPTPVSGWPNCALSEATIRSHAMASSQPPPRQYPETAATSGVQSPADRVPTLHAPLVVEVDRRRPRELRRCPRRRRRRGAPSRRARCTGSRRHGRALGQGRLPARPSARRRARSTPPGG